jgi:hypothetical protein
MIGADDLHLLGECEVEVADGWLASDAATIGERRAKDNRDERNDKFMATTGILRSRRSAAQLHAIASVEREIRAIDPAAGRKYLRDFREAYRSYENVLARPTSAVQVANAGIVLVGDYHALPNSQRYLASLLRDPISTNVR